MLNHKEVKLNILIIATLCIASIVSSCKEHYYQLEERHSNNLNFGKLSFSKKKLDDIKQLIEDLNSNDSAAYLSEISNEFLSYVNENKSLLKNNDFEYFRLIINLEHTVDSLIDMIIELGPIQITYASSLKKVKHHNLEPITYINHFNKFNYYTTYIEPIIISKKHIDDYVFKFTYKGIRSTDKKIIFKKEIDLLFKRIDFTY